MSENARISNLALAFISPLLRTRVRFRPLVRLPTRRPFEEQLLEQSSISLAAHLAPLSVIEAMATVETPLIESGRKMGRHTPAEIRVNFVVKVYGIVISMLFVTGCISYPFIFYESATKAWIKDCGVSQTPEHCNDCEREFMLLIPGQQNFQATGNTIH